MLSPTSKRIVIAAGLLAAVAVLDAWAGTASLGVAGVEAGEPSGPRVVLLVPLSGERSEEGRSAMRGFGLAVERLLPAGTAPVLVDSRCDVGYATAALDQLVAHPEIDAVVGGLCPEVSAMLRRKFRSSRTVLARLDQKTVAEATAVFPDSLYVERYGTQADEAARSAYEAVRLLGL